MIARTKLVFNNKLFFIKTFRVNIFKHKRKLKYVKAMNTTSTVYKKLSRFFKFKVFQ